MFDPHLYKDRFGYTLGMDAVDPNLCKYWKIEKYS